MFNGGGLCDRLDRGHRQPIGGGDHFAQGTFLKKADLTELLLTHLFIRSALQFFGTRLVDDMGDLLFGELATEPGFLPFDRHVPLLRPFREPFNKLGLDTFDFKSRAGAPGGVTKLVETLGQFIAIDCRAVIDGAEHVAGLKRLPTPFRLVPGAVEQDEMRVQLWVKRAGGGVQESRADQIASNPVTFLDAPLPNPCGGELFQFPERDSRRFLVRLDDAPVIHRDGQNRNGLGRRTHEVEINPAFPEMLRRQLFTRFWMLVIAQFQERFTGNDTTRLQSQPFSAGTNPMTMFCFSLGVIIIMGQVLVEIRLRTRPILLWNAAKHGSTFYVNAIRQVVMKPLQPDCPFLDKMTLMPGTVA